MPPSMNVSSPIRVAGSRPGTDDEASTAGMSGPESNTFSAARSMLAATTRSGTARSSKVVSAPRNRSNIRRSGAGEFRWVRVRTSREA